MGPAQPCAGGERAHRRGDPAMRTAGAPVVCVAQPPRLDRGIVRHADRTGEPRSPRRVRKGGAFRPATCKFIDVGANLASLSDQVSYR